MNEDKRKPPRLRHYDDHRCEYCSCYDKKYTFCMRYMIETGNFEVCDYFKLKPWDEE
jgi:hypothetical protein